MNFKLTGNFLSLGLLVYIIWLLLPMVDPVPTKNMTLNNRLQTELDAEGDVTKLKKQALRYLLNSYEDRVRQSETAKKACLILGGLLLIQAGTLAAEYRRTKNNSM